MKQPRHNETTCENLEGRLNLEGVEPMISRLIYCCYINTVGNFVCPTPAFSLVSCRKGKNWSGRGFKPHADEFMNALQMSLWMLCLENWENLQINTGVQRILWVIYMTTVTKLCLSVGLSTGQDFWEELRILLTQSARLLWKLMQVRI